MILLKYKLIPIAEVAGCLKIEISILLHASCFFKLLAIHVMAPLLSVSLPIYRFLILIFVPMPGQS